jgi:hypothetical protein
MVSAVLCDARARNSRAAAREIMPWRLGPPYSVAEARSNSVPLPPLRGPFADGERRQVAWLTPRCRSTMSAVSPLLRHLQWTVLQIGADP